MDPRILSNATLVTEAVRCLSDKFAPDAVRMTGEYILEVNPQLEDELVDLEWFINQIVFHLEASES